MFKGKPAACVGSITRRWVHPVSLDTSKRVRSLVTEDVKPCGEQQRLSIVTYKQVILYKVLGEIWTTKARCHRAATMPELITINISSTSLTN